MDSFCTIELLELLECDCYDCYRWEVARGVMMLGKEQDQTHAWPEAKGDAPT